MTKLYLLLYAVQVQSIGFFSTRVYILVWTSSCSTCRLHPSAIRVDRTQLSSDH